eukprot:GFUD01086695.1.p3 GENE.GFUD01086695.1~~GFUD01086695.1.p3  ORF type:complete len:123 (-),score=32.50 GFUD01086695.1:8-376(-)
MFMITPPTTITSRQRSHRGRPIFVLIVSAKTGRTLRIHIPIPMGTAKLTRAMTSSMYGMASEDDTKEDPRAQIQKDVIAKAAMLEKNVMVTDKFMSPPSIAVQKLDPTPPGQQPSRSRPNLS